MGMHIAVIGAGIIGSSIAWRLAQRGCRVTLLDAGVMGGEASWAGAGMLAPGAEVSGPSAWSDLALASSAAYEGFVAELAAESGQPIDFRLGGAIEIAAGDQEIAELDLRVRAQAAIGIVSRAIEAAELERLAPGVILPPGGVARWFPADAIVNPRDIVGALRMACLARGVALRESSPVCSVEWRAGQAVIGTGEAQPPLAADGAVLAAGAWNSEVRVAFPAPAVFPVRGHLIGYHLPPGALPPILRRGHTYLLQRSSGFFLAGASSEEVGFDRRIDPEIVETLRANAERLFAPLRGLQAEPWIGFRPATISYQPEIRPLDPDTRIWLACGHFRNGILLAPETARRVAEGIIAAS